MGATLLGLQATVGVLVAKALTSSSTPYLQGAPQGYSPVLALDVFLVQVSIGANGAPEILLENIRRTFANFAEYSMSMPITLGP